MIIVIPEELYFEVLDSDRYEELLKRLGRLLNKYPIHSIVVGSMLGGKFSVLAYQDKPWLEEEF